MEVSGLEKVFETDYRKNTVIHKFSGKAISRGLCCYFLVSIGLQMILIKCLLPEATGGIDEKVTEETTVQNFSCTHEPTFFIIGVLGRF